ncbi:8713_t:CDS:2 [Scutellospora calospora]|uniref:8713_t:CDS:1 n=1 Tax=Scutellospora calospora TaxID=85575 RepID=A0ACA9LNB2_9GLOM|nr:8713_t:CDS:2 [Scutellospora calospora]
MSNTPPEQNNTTQYLVKNLAVSVEKVLNEKEKRKRSMEEIEDEIFDIEIQIKELKKKNEEYIAAKERKLEKKLKRQLRQYENK